MIFLLIRADHVFLWAAIVNQQPFRQYGILNLEQTPCELSKVSYLNANAVENRHTEAIVGLFSSGILNHFSQLYSVFLYPETVIYEPVYKIVLISIP